MTEKEEEIVRNIVKDFDDFYGYDPTWWYKTRRGEDGFMFSPQGVSCLIAAGGKDLYGDFDEVAQEIPEGFEWMGFNTVYSVTEMSLLACGFVDKDSQEDLRIIAQLLDKTMEEK